MVSVTEERWVSRKFVYSSKLYKAQFLRMNPTAWLQWEWESSSASTNRHSTGVSNFSMPKNNVD